jgi:hypothetical protein
MAKEKLGVESKLRQQNQLTEEQLRNTDSLKQNISLRDKKISELLDKVPTFIINVGACDGGVLEDLPDPVGEVGGPRQVDQGFTAAVSEEHPGPGYKHLGPRAASN